MDRRAAPGTYRFVTLKLDHDGRRATPHLRLPDAVGPTTPPRPCAPRAPRGGPGASSASSKTPCCTCASTTWRSAPSCCAAEGDPRQVLAAWPGSTRCSRPWRRPFRLRDCATHPAHVLKRSTTPPRRSSPWSTRALPSPAPCSRSHSPATASSCSTIRTARNACGLSALNFGAFPMGNGLTRLQTRFLGDAGPRRGRALEHAGELISTPEAAALELGVTFTPDDIDWDDEVRIASRSASRACRPTRSPAWSVNLRFGGPENCDTKIFGRLSAWQNWIFQRPNAVGDDGALTRYGAPESAKFDWDRRTSHDEHRRLRSQDPQQRRPAREQAPADGAREVAAELPRLVAGDGARGLQPTTSTCARPSSVDRAAGRSSAT
jgi:hypothetical protein